MRFARWIRQMAKTSIIWNLFSKWILNFEMKFRIQEFSEWNSEFKRFSETSDLFFYTQSITPIIHFIYNKKNKCEKILPNGIEFQNYLQYLEWKEDSRLFSEFKLAFENKIQKIEIFVTSINENFKVSNRSWKLILI